MKSLSTAVRSVVLTGLPVATNAVISATDPVIVTGKQIGRAHV